MNTRHGLGRLPIIAMLVCAANFDAGGPNCARAQTMSVRKNIATLTPNELASLRRGVAAMKARPDSDPTSWTFQASIHGTTAGTNPLFSQCEHGSIRFLAWHRAYLFYFERILRKAANDPDLTLPYWDWTNELALPRSYRSSTALIGPNPLYDSTRMINDGSILPLEVVRDDLNTALGSIAFTTSSQTGFTDSLEASPHGAVHVLIGGNMGSVPTSARDPIFWLHHCNIDRHWNEWLNRDDGRANPTESSFLDHPYTLVDDDGTNATFKIRDILSSRVLGYRYDDVLSPPSLLVVGGPEAVAGVRSPRRFKTVATSVAPRLEGVAGTTPLALEDVRVMLNLQSGGLESLDQASRTMNAKSADRVHVVLEDVELAAVPIFVYGVYLNLPNNLTDKVKSQLHYVGAINFVGKDEVHAHQAPATHIPLSSHKFSVDLDATKTVVRLKQHALWEPKKLTVTLRPLTTAPAPGRETAHRKKLESSADMAKIRFKRILLKTAE